MTILEDLKSGRLVVVPREALADLCNAVMADISEAKRRLDADIPKDAPVHPVSAFLTGTALHVGKARASPDHTAGLIALVEGMEREHDEAMKAAGEMDECQKSMFVKMKAAEALAAEARIRDLETALNGLLAPLGPNGYVLPAGAIATERARQALKEAPDV
jgi:hypothetical protein